MVGWHYGLNEFEQIQGDSEGQGKPGMLQFVRSQRIGQTQRLNNKQMW